MKYNNFYIHISQKIKKEQEKSVENIRKNFISFKGEQKKKDNKKDHIKNLTDIFNPKSKFNSKNVEFIVKNPDGLRKNLQFKKFRLEDLIKERAKLNDEQDDNFNFANLIENDIKDKASTTRKPFYYKDTNEIMSVNEFFYLRKILVQKTMEEKEMEKVRLRKKVNKIKDILRKNKLKYVENNYQNIVKHLQDKHGLITLDDEIEYEKLFKNVDKHNSNSLLLTMKAADKVLSSLLTSERNEKNITKQHNLKTEDSSYNNNINDFNTERKLETKSDFFFNINQKKIIKTENTEPDESSSRLYFNYSTVNLNEIPNKRSKKYIQDSFASVYQDIDNTLKTVDNVLLGQRKKMRYSHSARKVQHLPLRYTIEKKYNISKRTNEYNELKNVNRITLNKNQYQNVEYSKNYL